MDIHIDMHGWLQSSLPVTQHIVIGTIIQMSIFNIPVIRIVKR